MSCWKWKCVALSVLFYVLFDFAGQDDMPSVNTQEAMSCVPIESSATASIVEYGIKASSRLYVLWMSNVDHMVQYLLIVSFLISNYVSFLHAFILICMFISSLCSLFPHSAQTQFTLNSTETVVPSYSIEPLVPQSSIEPLEPPSSMELLVISSSIQTAPSLPCIDTPVMVIEDQPNLKYSSGQELIIILEDQETSLSPYHWSPASPSHLESPSDE